MNKLERLKLINEEYKIIIDEMINKIEGEDNIKLLLSLVTKAKDNLTRVKDDG